MAARRQHTAVVVARALHVSAQENMCCADSQIFMVVSRTTSLCEVHYYSTSIIVPPWHIWITNLPSDPNNSATSSIQITPLRVKSVKNRKSGNWPVGTWTEKNGAEMHRR